MCLNCHVVSVDIQIRSITALEEACKALGWQFMPYQKRYAWNESWVDDSPIPRFLFEPEEADRIEALSCDDRKAYMNGFLGNCDHAIKVPGAKYEIGVIQYGEEFRLVWDWWGPGGLQRVLGTPDDNTNPLPQSYALQCELELARNLGYSAEHTTNGSGEIELTLTNWS